MMIKSVVIVVVILHYNHCQTPRHRIKEALVVSLRVQQSSSGFPILPKLIWCSSEGCIPSQSLRKTSKFRSQFCGIRFFSLHWGVEFLGKGVPKRLPRLGVTGPINCGVRQKIFPRFQSSTTFGVRAMCLCAGSGPISDNYVDKTGSPLWDFDVKSRRIKTRRTPILAAPDHDFETQRADP
ncbi:hypothetical protein TNCV_3875941 [Trichonephila clavipes]|uniref:Secreted protein n=1 Tax=Trichonephila clavipes TaxID=2585209 RepID=A0A8X6T2V1_TRICX|nr:hypothetical protein TNCV_3875941 [Trichonephila clavipes]